MSEAETDKDVSEDSDGKPRTDPDHPLARINLKRAVRSKSVIRWLTNQKTIYSSSESDSENHLDKDAHDTNVRKKRKTSHVSHMPTTNGTKQYEKIYGDILMKEFDEIENQIPSVQEKNENNNGSKISKIDKSISPEDIEPSNTSCPISNSAQRLRSSRTCSTTNVSYAEPAVNSVSSNADSDDSCRDPNFLPNNTSNEKILLDPSYVKSISIKGAKSSRKKTVNNTSEVAHIIPKEDDNGTNKKKKRNKKQDLILSKEIDAQVNKSLLNTSYFKKIINKNKRVPKKKKRLVSTVHILIIIAFIIIIIIIS